MIFIDTNILVDLADSDRVFHPEAQQLLMACARQRITMTTSVLCIGTFCYLLERKMKLKAPEIKKWMKDLSSFLTLLPTSNQMLELAASSSFIDVEDAILYFTATSNECESFITNNIKDFTSALEIPVLTPSQMIKIISDAD
jgi:predicted nucleic acid-binding protein